MRQYPAVERYSTRSAITNPTRKNRLLAGRKGMTSSTKPNVKVLKKNTDGEVVSYSMGLFCLVVTFWMLGIASHYPGRDTGLSKATLAMLSTAYIRAE